jgi:hypothetical protein
MHAYVSANDISFEGIGEMEVRRGEGTWRAMSMCIARWGARVSTGHENVVQVPQQQQLGMSNHIMLWLSSPTREEKQDTMISMSYMSSLDIKSFWIFDFSTDILVFHISVLLGCL